MKKPLTLTADATVWYAIESALKFTVSEGNLGEDTTFVKNLLHAVSTAITEAENGAGNANIF